MGFTKLVYKMKKKLYLFFAAVIMMAFNSYGQGFKAPSEGKAVVYITRVAKLGAAVNFRYFHNDQFIGRFNAGKYIRYECEPGEHLFWAKSENRDFVTAELEAGKIYVIDAKVQMGGMKARVKLVPIDFKDPKYLAKIEKLVNKKPPFEMKEADMTKLKAKFADDIKKSLEKYETTLKEQRTIAHLAPDMVYTK